MEQYFVQILLIAIGLFMFFKPELIWKLEHFLTVKDGEPRESYLAITRVCGVVLALVTSVRLFTSLVG